jgi:hypothetical protein
METSGIVIDKLKHIGHLVTYHAMETSGIVIDKLKHIGHLVTYHVMETSGIVIDKLKHIGHRGKVGPDLAAGNSHSSRWD